MEILGVVASGVALVDAAIKLADTCRRLQQFWESVNEAPDDVKYIVNDLNLLGNILADIAKQKDVVPSVRVVLKTCLERTTALEKIVYEFEAVLASPQSKGDRLWAAIKFTAKDKKLKWFRELLGDAKQTLMLGLMCQNIQRPRLAFTNQDAHFVSVVAPSSLDAGDQLRNPIPTKTCSHGGNNVSNDDDDAASPTSLRVDGLDLTAAKLPPVSALSEADRNRAIVSSKTVQSFMREALHMAVDSLFASGTVEQLMDATLDSVTAFESISSGTYAEDGNHVKPVHRAFGSDQPGSRPEVRQPSSQGGCARFSRSRVCHQTSSMGVVLGSIWIRTSTLKVDDESDAHKRRLEVITSFIFYPASWLCRFGFGYGAEANLNYSVEKGWKFNFVPVRAVPEDSLIFELCRQGETRAVELMLARGAASVKDTSPKGWSPLHYAAAGGHVDLCAVLLGAGADKNGLAYEGPAENALSPVTMFASNVHAFPAAERIRMLELFADTLDISDPSGEGWVVQNYLIKALNRERVPMTEICANWLLRSTGAELVVACGARTVWDGLQHAVRTFLSHQQDGQILLELLELKGKKKKRSNGGEEEEEEEGQGAIDDTGIEMQSLVTAMSHWLALRASQRVLLPMIIEAGRLMKMARFDWIEDNITPREYVRTFPVIYSSWAKELPKGIENLRAHMEEELEHVLSSLCMDRSRLKHAIRAAPAAEQEHVGDAQESNVCSECGDSYVKLGAGLVQPQLIVFDECCKTGHKRGCSCEAFLSDIGVTGTTYTTHADGGEEDSESEVDEEFFTDDTDDTLIDRLCQVYNKMRPRDTTKTDSFQTAATFLYRAQGRIWVGSYKAMDFLCGTCFLKREKYISADGDSRGQFFTPMPEAYGAYALHYDPASTIAT